MSRRVVWRACVGACSAFRAKEPRLVYSLVAAEKGPQQEIGYTKTGRKNAVIVEKKIDVSLKCCRTAPVLPRMIFIV